MKNDVESVGDDADTYSAPGEAGLLDLTGLRASDVLVADDSALAYALRRLASELGDRTVTPILAGFSNFAPPDPEPH